jgi:hypothetical protein
MPDGGRAPFARPYGTKRANADEIAPRHRASSMLTYFGQKRFV